MANNSTPFISKREISIVHIYIHACYMLTTFFLTPKHLTFAFSDAACKLFVYSMMIAPLLRTSQHIIIYEMYLHFLFLLINSI